MTSQSKSALEIELGELYDIRTRRVREKKKLLQEAQEIKKDIRLITLMFSDGILDLSLRLGQQEILEWDFRAKRLIYHRGEVSQFIESAKDDVLIRIRPYLKDLVKKAKDNYVNGPT